VPKTGVAEAQMGEAWAPHSMEVVEEHWEAYK
jgi:hypothetical protein